MYKQTSVFVLKTTILIQVIPVFEQICHYDEGCCIFLFSWYIFKLYRNIKIKFVFLLKTIDKANVSRYPVVRCYKTSYNNLNTNFYGRNQL